MRKHVVALSSAYCHDELQSEDSRRVAEHLMACTVCREEFEQVKLGVKFGQQLELVAAPDTLWRSIEAQLEHGPRRSAHFYFFKPLALAAGVVLAVAAGFFFMRSDRPESPAVAWEVARLDGSPRIGTAAITDRSQLAVGQWLETDANSRAKVAVSTIGNVEIDPNTRVRLVESKPTEHRLELERGRLSARIVAPPKLFFVDTPSGVAEDLGCAYTLEVDDNGNSILHVTSGWVALQLTDRESKVPAGAACAARRGIGLGTPYFVDASDKFRTALSSFDFDGPQAKASALNVIINEARPRDAMTLWYLLSRVQEFHRASVYDRLAGFVTPPEGVTRAGVLALNPSMLNRWREEIDNARSVSPAPPLQASFKGIWTRAFTKVHAWEGKK